MILLVKFDMRLCSFKVHWQMMLLLQEKVECESVRTQNSCLCFYLTVSAN